MRRLLHPKQKYNTFLSRNRYKVIFFKVGVFFSDSRLELCGYTDVFNNVYWTFFLMTARLNTIFSPYCLFFCLLICSRIYAIFILFPPIYHSTALWRRKNINFPFWTDSPIKNKVTSFSFNYKSYKKKPLFIWS